MWCYIHNEDVDNYLKQYFPGFKDEDRDIFKIYQNNTITFLPKFFLYNYPSNKLIEYYGKNNLDSEKINVKCNVKLRPLQKKAVEVVLNQYRKDQSFNGILKLYPGAGKTVLSIYILAQFGLKTCIIVDTEDLKRQWIKEIIQFTDLTENDIGIIHRNIFLTNKPICITLVQTLLSKLKNNFDQSFKLIDSARFGTVIYDEVHSVSSSEKYAKASLFFRSKNIIGLSATPFANGVAEVLMKNTVGDIKYETKDYKLIPKYYMIYYYSNVDSDTTGKVVKSGKNKGNDVTVLTAINRCPELFMKKAIYTKYILEKKNYQILITKYTKALLNINHVVMIICNTKKQVIKISEVLEENGIENRRYYGDEQEIEKDTDNVLVVTYKFCGKGFNMPRISALIYASSFSGKTSMIQTIGRILRDYKDKKQPVVIDLIDKSCNQLFASEIPRKIKILENEFDGCEIVHVDQEEIKNATK